MVRAKSLWPNCALWKRVNSSAMNEPSWLKIIRAWCAQPGRTGPTFPFVFGAIRTPPGEPVTEGQARVDFVSLVDAMKSYAHTGEFLAVHDCPIIRQPVITIQRNPFPTSGPWADLISAKPQPRKLEAWRKSGSAQGLQPIIA